MCRRCGAPLHPEESNRIALPPTLTRRGAVVTAAAPTAPISPAAAALAAFRDSPTDTMLPGAMPRPDNLLPRPARAKAAATRVSRSAPEATRPRFVAQTVSIARTHRRPILVLAIVAVALTTSVVAVWPVVFRTNTSSAPSNVAADARASALLRTVAGGGRTFFASHRSFTGLSPAELSGRSYHVAVVASTTAARLRQVSMAVTNATTLTLATPAASDRCVFARDAPTQSTGQSTRELAGIEFVTVRTTDCRASAAPARGWSAS
jgi:hypothetical protein